MVGDSAAYNPQPQGNCRRRRHLVRSRMSRRAGSIEHRQPPHVGALLKKPLTDLRRTGSFSVNRRVGCRTRRGSGPGYRGSNPCLPAKVLREELLTSGKVPSEIPASHRPIWRSDCDLRRRPFSGLQNVSTFRARHRCRKRGRTAWDDEVLAPRTLAASRGPGESGTRSQDRGANRLATITQVAGPDLLGLCDECVDRRTVSSHDTSSAA
jgi:hypothetical protein